MPTVYHPAPVWVSYGDHIIDADMVFGFQKPSLLLQIASIAFRNAWSSYSRPKVTLEQRANLVLSAINLRELSLPGYYCTVFEVLAGGIPALDDGPSTVWPYLRTLDFRSSYRNDMSHEATRDASWIIASAPALNSVAMYSPTAAPRYVPSKQTILEFRVQDKVSSTILLNSITAANLRTLTLNNEDSTGRYNQPPAFPPMADVILAAAPALSNLRTLNVREFGPKDTLSNAIVALVALPSLRTIRLLIIGEGDVRREAALLTRIFNAMNPKLRTLGLMCATSPAQRRGPLPLFVVDGFAKAELPRLRTVSYAARRVQDGHVYPPLRLRPNVQKLKALCVLRRVKLEVVELASRQAWPGDMFN